VICSHKSYGNDKDGYEFDPGDARPQRHVHRLWTPREFKEMQIDTSESSPDGGDSAESDKETKELKCGLADRWLRPASGQGSQPKNGIVQIDGKSTQGMTN